MLNHKKLLLFLILPFCLWTQIFGMQKNVDEQLQDAACQKKDKKIVVAILAGANPCCGLQQFRNNNKNDVHDIRTIDYLVSKITFKHLVSEEGKLLRKDLTDCPNYYLVQEFNKKAEEIKQENRLFDKIDEEIEKLGNASASSKKSDFSSPRLSFFKEHKLFSVIAGIAGCALLGYLYKLARTKTNTEKF